MDKKITVVGAGGKMGKLICEKLEGRYIVYKVTAENSVYDFPDTNLVIDFSVPSQSLISANFCKQNLIPLILGTTGLSEMQNLQIESAAKIVPVYRSANFSLGIKILLELLPQLKQRLGAQQPDIIITEKHHRDKIDSPSGTALEIKNAAENIGQSVMINSVRGGKEIGTHTIDIYFGDELLSISHKAFSRDAFVDGVVKLADTVLCAENPKEFLH